MAINFPDSPTNGQSATLGGNTWTYNSASGAWARASSGGGSSITTYDSTTDLPLSGVPAGDQAFVTGSNRMYVSNGTGWYSVSLVNTNPNITSVQDSDGGTTPFTLATDGTGTVITVTASDPEDVPLTYNYSVTSGSLTNGGGTTATVVQGTDSDVNKFTITPSTTEAYAGAFELTFTASDGINTATNANSFTLSFTSWGSVTQQAKIQASDAAAGDYFGQTVSLSGDGDTAIVGAYSEDTGGTDAGSAYIFTRSGASWSQQQKIQASDAAAGDYFGFSVSLSGDGDIAIVGASLEDSFAGSAYIFTRSGTTWSQQAKIQASNAGSGDQFGISVSLSNDGDTAIVSAMYEDTAAGNAGAAYIFTRSGTSWSQEAQLQGSGLVANDYFGVSVSISSDGNTALVGARNGDTTATDSGSAYIFTRSGTSWTQQAKIQASDAEAGDRFGFSVSLSGDGDTAIIGAYREDTVASNAGSAYIFTRSGSTWSQQQKIQASNAGSGDWFGFSVSLSGDGDIAIVGASLEDTAASNAGSAYIFTRSGTSWSQQQNIQASDAEADDRFGTSVSLSNDGNTALVSASLEDTGGAEAGSAYIFVP